jgi:hypothetical protein
MFVSIQVCVLFAVDTMNMTYLVAFTDEPFI